MITKYFFILISTNRSGHDIADSSHLSLTEQSIIYNVSQYSSGCRCSCCDQGAVMKEIRYERIQDITVRHPAGGCLCTKPVLTFVDVQTAGAGVGVEMSLGGLKDPEGFRAAVQAMRSNARHLPDSVGPVKGKAPGIRKMGDDNDETTALLRSINRSLQNIEVHLTRGESTTSSASS
jgi:hypothetical protein